ncbi:MAG: xylanase [Oscillospiraceae bacterium]|nr:xylanase [Oscillospiraceae bacterium]
MNKEYRNILGEMGMTDAQIKTWIDNTFNTMFHGAEDVRIYHEAGADMGYMVDTGNIDARTEGMSYGMMMCVQLDKKEEFDRIWKWSYTYMYTHEGEHGGYFAWSCALDGRHNADGPAPDGEEFFAMALFFASHRWGDGEGIFNYSKMARQILHDCLHRGGEGEHIGRTMWDLDNKLIRFVPGVDFSDPSYHLMHFYDLFALWADECDRQFWADAAKASRKYLHTACHPKTGLCSDYAHFDGSPVAGVPWGRGKRRIDRFYSDSYRTAANIGLDWSWNGVDSWQCENNAKLQKFFKDNEEQGLKYAPRIDGEFTEEEVMHPTGLIATNAAASLASWTADADEETVNNAKYWVKKFMETPLREGKRRYYDNCLYLFALLALSGNYRIY